MDEDTLAILKHIHKHGPVTTKSNLARVYSDEIAVAASRGWLSVILPDGEVGRSWRLTSPGLALISLNE